MKGLGTVYQQFEQAFGATAKVFEYIGLAEEPAVEPGVRALPPFSRIVEFDRVSFGYDPELPILRDISLEARAGEVIAIVGSSGAGKTTLVNLLPRFYPVTSGVLRVDGVDIREVTLRSLREQMAIVTQETILFNDTVWNNICYGRPGLPQERVEAAAKAALAHDFILELPQGYQTMLGDRGQRLSGGQRQRIAIARAILKDSPILILDEATSELDSESEMLVQRALSNLMMGRTAFVIAHRLSTIRRADKIIVLEDGMIAEVGTHQELLAKGGTYARLYEMQFADTDDVATPAMAPPPPPDRGSKDESRHGNRRNSLDDRLRAGARRARRLRVADQPAQRESPVPGPPSSNARRLRSVRIAHPASGPQPFAAGPRGRERLLRGGRGCRRGSQPRCGRGLHEGRGAIAAGVQRQNRTGFDCPVPIAGRRSRSRIGQRVAKRGSAREAGRATRRLHGAGAFAA